MVSQKPGRDQTMTLINIVLVNISDSLESILTYAMIDPGAEVTLIWRDMAEKLELAAKLLDSIAHVESWRGDRPTFQALAIDLIIANIEENFDLQVENAQVVPLVNASGRMISWELMRSDWPHLDSLDMPVVQTRRSWSVYRSRRRRRRGDHNDQKIYSTLGSCRKTDTFRVDRRWKNFEVVWKTSNKW